MLKTICPSLCSGINNGSMMNMMGSMGSNSSSHFDINSPEFGGSSNNGSNNGNGSSMGGPLSQLSESVNKMDPLGAMEKSLSMSSMSSGTTHTMSNMSSSNNNHPHMGPPPLTTSPPTTSTSPVISSTSSTSHAGSTSPNIGHGAPALPQSSCGGPLPAITTPQVLIHFSSCIYNHYFAVLILINESQR